MAGPPLQIINDQALCGPCRLHFASNTLHLVPKVDKCLRYARHSGQGGEEEFFLELTDTAYQLITFLVIEEGELCQKCLLYL